MLLTSSQQDTLDGMLQDLRFPRLYKTFSWRGDTWKKGFSELCRLEKEISQAARGKMLTEEHLQDIAFWGGLRNRKRISCPRFIKIQLYARNNPVSWLKKEPDKAVWLLENQIQGFGPTYCSKILQFAVPGIFGALDTRIVRTCGRGDRSAQCYPLLDLKATRIGASWAVFSSQPGWPDQFRPWTNALNYLADSLNHDKVRCPHPTDFIQAGLRQKGTWLPADVETALFSFATGEIAKA